MQFQGRELHIGDRLVSKRCGEIEVNSLHKKFFTATPPGSRQSYEWDYEGQYCYVDDQSIDATWPDPSPEQPSIPFAPNPQPRPEREGEYRRIWLELALRPPADSSLDELTLIHQRFDYADAFLAELKRRDGEGKGAIARSMTIDDLENIPPEPVRQNCYLYLFESGEIRVFVDDCPNASAKLRVWRDEDGKTKVEVVND